MNLRQNITALLAASAVILSLCGANAAIVGSFDAGDPTAASVQATFTAIGAAGTTPAAYAGPQSAISGLITLRLTAGTTLAAATTKDASGNFNSTGNLVARNRNIPAADNGTFTYSSIYRDFVTGNALGIQLSGLAANAAYAVTFYAYDNNGSRTQTFTDVTVGGTGFSGTITYTTAYSFTSTTPNNIFAVTINATSDASGRLFFSETGTGNTNVAVLGGVVVDGSAAPAYPGFHHAYNGGFTDSSSAGNTGIPSGGASITTESSAIASGTGALTLDGADGSYVTLTTPGGFSATTAWSATWWARRGELGGQKGMVMGAAANSTDFIWLNDSFTGLRFRSSNNTTFDFTAPKDMELRHYALVADGAGNLSLYLNGRWAQTLTGNTSFIIDTIGKAYPTTALHYKWMIDVFSAADINAGLAEPDADRDGDGQSNRAEFLGASDPLSGTSSFRASFIPISVSAGQISYDSSVGRLYSVQHYIEASDTWKTALPALRGTGATVVRSLNLTTSRGMYRVQCELP